MDICDEAQAIEEAERAAALARHRTRLAESGTASAFICAACEDEIPHARRKLLPGVQFCTHCAGQIERYGRTRGT